MGYTSRPELYDLEYSFKDYASEAATPKRIVDERNPDASTLLDVACGTGKHLEHVSRRFECEGTDLDEGLLDVARTRVPDVPRSTSSRPTRCEPPSRRPASASTTTPTG